MAPLMSQMHTHTNEHKARLTRVDLATYNNTAATTQTQQCNFGRQDITESRFPTYDRFQHLRLHSITLVPTHTQRHVTYPSFDSIINEQIRC